MKPKKFIRFLILSLVIASLTSIPVTISARTNISQTEAGGASQNKTEKPNVAFPTVTEIFSQTAWLPLMIKSQGAAISDIEVLSTEVKVFEKYEVRFSIATGADYPFFEYTESPPPGVLPKTGITVEGVFTTPSGQVVRQPAFYTTEVERIGSGASMYFVETNKSYWVVRFSPQEPGQYNVALSARDASGATAVSVGSFSAAAPVRKGFIQVSRSDPRYFEFSNGDLYWPIGPAWADNISTNPNVRKMDYSQYKNTGQNLERPWMAGQGAYSTNFARWISSAEAQGNEGVTSRLNFVEKYPGHELSYEISYPEGFRIWIPRWGNDMFAPRLKPNTTYQINLVFKTKDISGPRQSGYPYGFVIRLHDFLSHEQNISTTETTLRNKPKIIEHITSNQDWRTLNTTFTTPATVGTDISLYLDNVTRGNVYIDQFSMKEVLSGGTLGGELIRNPVADMHTYVDPRAAAFFDWQVEQGEQNGVFFKYVVHDKNDWIQNHLLMNGQWAAQGDGYYQPENTKARWLLRQWYRYLAARWGYSTAIHSWELNNEGPPTADPLGSGTAPHWTTAQTFGKYMHDIDAHPHLVSTSFWCCWPPEFWGNQNNFPDIDYADIHEYTGNPQVAGQSYTNDMAAFIGRIGDVTLADHVGKPVLLGEHGISVNGWDNIAELRQPNPGIWYHNFLWGGLHPGAVTAPNYWYSEHLGYINREQISTPFDQFVKTLDLNDGGYIPLSATVSNPKLRVFGQKNLAKDQAHFWVQNADHTWKQVMAGTTSTPSGTVTIKMNPGITYTLEWWNTYSGAITQRQSLRSNTAGDLAISVTNLRDDVAIKIFK